MGLFKSEGRYQQAYDSKNNDVTAFHTGPKDISIQDMTSTVLSKFPLLVGSRGYYRVKRLFDKKPSQDLTPETLYSLIETTGLSRYVRGDLLDLKYFGNIGMATARVNLDHEKKIATPEPLENETPEETMDRAQRACFLAVPIHYHSFVHFHGPTAMAIYAEQTKNKKFKKLLKRHTRYTLVYNNGGIEASSSDFFCDKLLPDYSNKRASDSILGRVQQYWNITKSVDSDLPPARDISNPENFDMDWEPKLKSELAFEKKIMSFYPLVRSYVDAQNISKEDLADFAKWFSENIYPIPEELHKTTIPLTYLVWSNSVVHSLEHAEYYKWKDHARYGPKTDDDSWYRYFMNTFTRPYGSLFRNEKLSKYIPEIKELDGHENCYISIQF